MYIAFFKQGNDYAVANTPKEDDRLSALGYTRISRKQYMRGVKK